MSKRRKYAEEYVLILRDGNTNKKLFVEWDCDLKRLEEKFKKYIRLKYL